MQSWAVVKTCEEACQNPDVGNYVYHYIAGNQLVLNVAKLKAYHL